MREELGLLMTRIYIIRVDRNMIQKAGSHIGNAVNNMRLHKEIKMINMNYQIIRLSN